MQHPKNIKMRFLLLIFFFILVAKPGIGSVIKIEKAKPVPVVLQKDTSSAVTVRHLDSAALKAYSKQHEFQYKETTADLSWWDRFWTWFWQWLGGLFHFEKGMSILSTIIGIIEILLVLAGIAGLIYVILRSVGIDVRNIFQGKSAATPIPYSEFFEDINNIDFDAEIENAVAKHNYRFAVRLLYLKCLKQLSNAGLIDWQIDKTNTAYINELTNEEQRGAFKILTRQFEYVWYGEFLIDAPVYKNIDSSFSDFNKRVA